MAEQKKEEWPRRKKGKGINKGEAEKANMTPMIDVCFQLLIFFMVTSKFKTLEGKLAAYLPKDKGLQNYKIEEQALPVRVVLRWNPTIRRCKVYVGQVLCNYDDQGISRALQKVKQIKQTGTDKAEIDAGGDVPMEWVVQALNMLIRADMPEINFTGAMDPMTSNK
jgi:biopolymer transport protein ExbD